MKKVCFFFLLSLLTFPAYAEDVDFVSDTEQLGHIRSIEKPKCSDEDFQAKVINAAKTYMEKANINSTISKRKKTLKLAGFKSFTPVSVKGFTPDDDYHTANALITIKINERVAEEDIILCKQSNVDKNPVYVLVFPYLNNFKGYVINLDEKNPDYDAISFIYP